MRRSVGFPQAACLAGVTAALGVTAAVWAVSGALAGESSTFSTIYTSQEVLRAFSSVGAKLYDAGYSSFASPVDVLATVESHQGWDAAVYVYPNASQAAASYRAHVGEWRGSGVAATESKNLVVTVVRDGEAATRTSRPWPIPPLVRKALDIVGGRRGERS